MLAKEKVPALARSESHDIGHAEGGKDISFSPQEEKIFLNDLKKEIKKELRFLTGK